MDYFLNKGGAKNIVFPFEDMVKNSGSAQKMDEYAAAGDQAGFAQAAFLFGLLLLITAYAFILLSIILVVRQAMLMVLLILSPLGFFCAVFKATKPAFSKWWNEFLKWSFIGVGIVFFIYLAAYLVAVGIPGVSKQTNQDQQEQLGSLAFLVPIIFLILGAKIARSSSAIGASSVLSLATGAAGFVAGKVMSATGGTIKGAHKATKESRVGQKVSRGVSAAKEKLGLTTAGATRRLGAEQAKEYAKDLEHSSDQQLAKAALSRTNAPRAAAALDKLRERKKLDMLPQNRMGTLMAKAEQFGYKREDFEKVNPNLAGIEGRGYDAVRERVRGMSTAEQKKMQNTALTPAVLSSMAPEQFKKLTPAQKDHVRQTYIHSPRGSAGKQEMKSHIRMLRGTRRTEDIPNLATNLRMASGTGTTPRGPRTRPPTPQGPGPTPPRTPPPPGGGAFRPPAPGTTQYRPRTRPPRGGGRRRGP